MVNAMLKMFAILVLAIMFGVAAVVALSILSAIAHWNTPLLCYAFVGAAGCGISLARMTD
ncbi:MAG: hypothetical protein JWN75_145 [Candidatus Saccharibacteria bacterium]|nr:hypothetical protein [Candidatus Saccharibacteria bacterium]